MRILPALRVVLLALVCGSSWAGPTQWVDPFIGTGGGGNTFPGALVPWGMVSVSPHNDLQAPSGYIYGKPQIYGFGHVHLSGTGCPDLGSVLILPTVGEVQVGMEDRKAVTDSETASPGYYQVHLTKTNILAEMTATCRVGMSRYTFSGRKGDANILLDVSHRLTSDPVTIRDTFESKVKVVSPSEVEGFTQSGDFCSVYSGNRQTVYFVARFSKPASSMGTWKEGKKDSGLEQSGRGIGAYLRFSTASGESIVVKVGISYVSVANARQNLDSEAPGWDFEAVRAAAQRTWDTELSKIKVVETNPEKLKVFYTALYHCLIHPNVFNDVNGEYQGMSHSGVKKAENYTRYTVFSLWDTYRNLHPLLTLVYPERQLDMVRSLVEMAKEGGRLPKWELAGNETSVMVGDPAVAVIADTYLKGLKDFDVESAFASMKKSLEPDDDKKVFGGLRSLLKYGYIPKDDYQGDWVWGSVSTTQEFALDFWDLAQMAQEMKETAVHDAFMKYSGAYRNYYDPSTGFLRPRNSDGSWYRPFNPLATCCDQSWANDGGPGFVEGNAWQYLFYAPQDMDGLILLLGGNSAFTARLQACFDGGHYDPTNEPDIAWPYLFDYVPGEAWRGQKILRDIMARSYRPAPDGIPGNDDAGTMSAWYVFSAMGIYPVCPGSSRYQFGSPLFRQVDIKLNKAFYPGGNISLKTINNADNHPYVQSVLVDGMPFKDDSVKHLSLIFGKTIVFRMDSQPKE